MIRTQRNNTGLTSGALARQAAGQDAQQRSPSARRTTTRRMGSGGSPRI